MLSHPKTGQFSHKISKNNKCVHQLKPTNHLFQRNWKTNFNNSIIYIKIPVPPPSGEEEALVSLQPATPLVKKLRKDRLIEEFPQAPPDLIDDVLGECNYYHSGHN